MEIKEEKPKLKVKMESGNLQYSHGDDPGSRRTPVSIKDEDKEKIRPQIGNQWTDEKTNILDKLEGPIQFGQNADVHEAPVPDHLLPYLTGERQIHYKVKVLLREDGTSEEAVKLALFTQFNAPPLTMFTGKTPMNTLSGPFWTLPPLLVSDAIDTNEGLESFIRKQLRTTPKEEYQKEDPTE